MPRGRKKLTLEEKIRETQQSIYNLENRTQELYEELQGLLEEQKRQELEKLSDALEEAGVSVEEVLEQLRTQEEERTDGDILPDSIPARTVFAGTAKKELLPSPKPL